MMAMACAAAFCGSVLAETNETMNAESSIGWHWAMGQGITYEKMPVVSAEVALGFDSKFLSYGLVDNNEPVLVPAATLTFADALTVGVDAVYDVTRYGERAGYGRRAWRHQEINSFLALERAFGPNDAAWLPTKVEFSVLYRYESHPEAVSKDSQFVLCEMGLPDIWFEPYFLYEQDLARDYGSYLNLNLGHTFALIGPRPGESEDVLDFRFSIAQGWGDARRISAYLWRLDQSGLMDTTVMGTFNWVITEGLTLGAYVAYTDYLFNPPAREAAEHYEVTRSWTKSWNFVAGVSIAVVF